MTEFFERQYELLLNDEPYIDGKQRTTSGHQLRAVFSVTQDYGGYVSYCDLSLYNLSQGTIGKLYSQNNVEISLRAGYVNNIDFIFKGKVINLFKGRSGPDTITQIIARGGGEVNRTISQTLGKNTTIVEMIQACADALELPLVIKESDFSSESPYQFGSTLDGDPKQILTDLAKIHSFSFTINNGKIRVTKNTGFLDGTVQEVSQFTGMVGIPEISENGCDTTIKMNPRVKIGGRIEIKSELRTFNFSNVYYRQIPPNAGTGIYRVFRLVHSGDTHGDRWDTQITGFR